MLWSRYTTHCILRIPVVYRPHWHQCCPKSHHTLYPRLHFGRPQPDHCSSCQLDCWLVWCLHHGTQLVHIEIIIIWTLSQQWKLEWHTCSIATNSSIFIVGTVVLGGGHTVQKATFISKTSKIIQVNGSSSLPKKGCGYCLSTCKGKHSIYLFPFTTAFINN